MFEEEILPWKSSFWFLNFILDGAISMSQGLITPFTPNFFFLMISPFHKFSMDESRISSTSWMSYHNFALRGQVIFLWNIGFSVKWLIFLTFILISFHGYKKYLITEIVFENSRWSKIAQQLPGRTDNEIKNYWRTRVQKHAKQLKCDVNSKQFKDTMRYLWMPRLVERIQAAATTTITTAIPNNMNMSSSQGMVPPLENSSTAASSDSFGTQISPVSDMTDYYNDPVNNNRNQDYDQVNQINYVPDSLTSPSGYFHHGLDFQAREQNPQCFGSGDTFDNLWNVEDIWFLQQQLNMWKNSH